MNLQEISHRYDNIVEALDRREVIDAFKAIDAFITATKEFAFGDRLKELENTYMYMLRYYSEGATDPMQRQIYESTLIKAYELADKIRTKALMRESPLPFYETSRNLSIHPKLDFEALDERLLLESEAGSTKEFDTITSNLFNRIWTSGLLSPDETSSIRNLLFEDELPPSVGCQIVSALWLGIQHSFDKEKLSLLFDAAFLENKEIQVRAVICILLTLYIYRERTQLYPMIENRLSSMAEITGFLDEVRTIIMKFILSRTTEKITKKLETDIFPEMIKLESRTNKKLDMRNLFSEQNFNEANPEWNNKELDKLMEQRLSEFKELQSEGADVLLSTFTHLKNFPFFKEVGNWFLPFSMNHHIFINNGADDKEKKIIESMIVASQMCNSDMYSFYLSFADMPKESKEWISGLIGEHADMILENKENLAADRGEISMIAGQYIQDLYRFYKLFPSKNGFKDIFATSLDFHNLKILSPYLSDNKTLGIISEYYIRKEYYKDALPLLLKLTLSDPENGVIYQKLGYCFQMLGQTDDALEAYLNADLLNPDNKWLTKRIAGCYKAKKQYDKALEYYKKCNKMSTDNLAITLNIGHCYLELKEYSKAMKYFFKADYLDNDSDKSWRPIAWCSFLAGNFDQSRNYYAKILTASPTAQDYMNAGHTEWALDNVKQATAYYMKSIKMLDGEFDKFKEMFDQDTADIASAGIKDENIPMMMDIIRYKLSNKL